MKQHREALPGLAARVAFLRQPEHYPTAPQRVEAIETHMSWVFLTDRYAYKLKKPVRYDYLDFSTPEARRRDCQEEVRLNRRLAPDVYDGVVPLTADTQGSMQLAGAGDAIDWLVKMRRLPAERMLDRVIAAGTVHETEVRQVGALLARFYLQMPPVAISPCVYRQLLADSVQATYEELSKPIYALPAALVETALPAQLAFLEQAPELFEQRVHMGRILEAHGDLRPEHICLEAEPVIIDCLEFNRDLRILDTVSELAFLALECERLGASHVGERIVQTYSAATSDWPSASLLTFYKSFHAAMRAKIAIWHLKDSDTRTPTTWTNKASSYLRFAARLNRFVGRV